MRMKETSGMSEMSSIPMCVVAMWMLKNIWDLYLRCEIITMCKIYIYIHIWYIYTHTNILYMYLSCSSYRHGLTSKFEFHMILWTEKILFCNERIKKVQRNSYKKRNPQRTLIEKSQRVKRESRDIWYH